jgi:hypothetical protein
VADVVEAVHGEVHFARGTSGTALPGSTTSAARIAAARPKTTRSMSELEPRRFAP